MNLSPQKKIAGILAPLFGLRGDNDLGIGDVAVLREFIDWAAEIGFRVVQLLPINEIGGDNSPYSTISAMALEPTTLHLAPGSPQELTADDFQAALADVDLTKMRYGPVKYPRVKKLKRRLLDKAFVNFSQHPEQDRQSQFQAFCAEQAKWLDDYALFRTLMQENGENEAWDKWPLEHRSIASARVWLDRQSSEEKNRFRERETFFRYVQWIAHEQWSAVKSYAEQGGVKLMGDTPFGVSYYSADVFARPDEFVLDWCGGAPPETHFKDDEFTQKWGQNWGIPLYRWEVMRQRNFDWWRQRVRNVRHSFHFFRIDHVLGFYRIYAFPWRPQENRHFLGLDWNQMLARTKGRAPHFVPRDDSKAEDCDANRREGEEYLRMVLEESRDAPVVGEDLGTVPRYVRPSLRSLGIAGFKIPQWEFYHGRVIPGSEYERLSVATYATHDHPPLRALWDDAFEKSTATSEQARFELEKIARFTGFNRKRDHDRIEFERDFHPAAMEGLFKCESWIAIVMITDLLARKYRFNVPGVAATSNWTRRMQRSVSELRHSLKVQRRVQTIRTLLEKAGRV
jgi:4-alpha-glucanotransferase